MTPRMATTANSVANQVMRNQIAAHNAAAGPTIGARIVDKTTSRTPAPPGSNDTNPNTTANAQAPSELLA